MRHQGYFIGNVSNGLSCFLRKNQWLSTDFHEISLKSDDQFAACSRSDRKPAKSKSYFSATSCKDSKRAWQQIHSPAFLSYSLKTAWVCRYFETTSKTVICGWIRRASWPVNLSMASYFGKKCSLPARRCILYNLHHVNRWCYKLMTLSANCMAVTISSILVVSPTCF